MNIYVLKNPTEVRGNAVTDYAHAEGSPMGNAPRCTACGELVGLLPHAPPIRVELTAWGTRWGDIAFGSGSELLVSDRLRGLFVEANMTGIERFDPVEIVKIRKKIRITTDPPVYWLASVQRGPAVIDDTASGLVRERMPVCEECRTGGIIKRTARIVLKPGSWASEDVFVARGLPGTILVSQRFKKLCEEANLANCRLIAATEYSFDDYPLEPTSHTGG